MAQTQTSDKEKDVATALVDMLCNASASVSENMAQTQTSDKEKDAVFVANVLVDMLCNTSVSEKIDAATMLSYPLFWSTDERIAIVCKPWVTFVGSMWDRAEFDPVNTAVQKIANNLRNGICGPSCASSLLAAGFFPMVMKVLEKHQKFSWGIPLFLLLCVSINENQFMDLYQQRSDLMKSLANAVVCHDDVSTKFHALIHAAHYKFPCELYCCVATD